MFSTAHTRHGKGGAHRPRGTFMRPLRPLQFRRFVWDRVRAHARVRSVDMVEIKSFERLLQRLRDDRAHNGCIVCFGSNRNLRDSRARSVTKHVVYIERVNRTHTVHCISHRICMSDRNNAPLPPIGGRGQGRARKPLRNIYTIHPLRPI